MRDCGCRADVTAGMTDGALLEVGRIRWLITAVALGLLVALSAAAPGPGSLDAAPTSGPLEAPPVVLTSR